MKRAYLLMHLAIFLWGFTGIFGKAIAMNEGMIVWYRMCISAAALLVYMRWRGKALRTSPRMLWRMCAIGAIVAVHWLTFYASIKASNVSVALACFSSIALFTSVLEPFFFRVRHHFSELMLGIGVIGGLYLIFAFQQAHIYGMALALFSALLASIFTILNKKMVAGEQHEKVTFYELASGFVFLTLLLPLYYRFAGGTFEVPGGQDLLYLVLLSVICTTFAFTISMEALKKVKAFTMNLSVNLEPIYSIILAMIFFNEQRFLTAGFFWGAVVIIGSVAVHGLYTARKTGSI